MFNSNQNFDELFNNLAKSNKTWFDNLLKLSGSTEQQQASNPFLNMYQQFYNNSKTYLDLQNNFYQSQIAMWQSFIQSNKETSSIDRRFADPEWENNLFFSYLKQSYLSMAKSLLDFISKADMDEETKFRMNFYIGQYIDAISPSNFALTNPEVVKSVVETNGMSLANGMKNMMEDIQNGYIKMTDESHFAIGENLALTPGKVVFRNELIELIQYTPTTAKVYERPLLIIPPCINKYYILDLQQDNSLVRYLVAQGYTVYLISWKSADASIKSFRWEEYANLGAIKAIEVVRSISKQSKINTLGYCVGGIILTTAALLLKERKLDWINSMSHMTSMLDHSNPGDIKAFLNRDLLKINEFKKPGGGIMPGRIIGQTFSGLRANDLIWNYWINNYLLGKTPKPFDILYWNNDNVDLPTPMHSFLIERMYIDNDLVKNKLVIDGTTMDISKLTDLPCYFFAAQKDHIVPWESAYKSTNYIKGNDIRFVLGASGHSAGVINPVSTDKRNYWVNDNLPKDSDEWFKGATSMPGSWWKDYNIWLGKFSGNQIEAKKNFGSKQYPALCDAPGEYIKAKALPIFKAKMI